MSKIIILIFLNSKIMGIIRKKLKEKNQIIRRIFITGKCIYLAELL